MEVFFKNNFNSFFIFILFYNKAFLAWRRGARALRLVLGGGGRAGKPKTCWTKSLPRDAYGDCCRRFGREPAEGRAQCRTLTGTLAEM